MKHTFFRIIFFLFLTAGLFNLSFANPLDSAFNSIHDQTGMPSQSLSLGLRLNVPVEKPKDWNIGVYIPRPLDLLDNTSVSSMDADLKKKLCQNHSGGSPADSSSCDPMAQKPVLTR